jgi:hypothetical protein
MCSLANQFHKIQFGHHVVVIFVLYAPELNLSEIRQIISEINKQLTSGLWIHFVHKV